MKKKNPYFLNKLLNCYKRLLVSIYSTHFNENKYEDKFIGMFSGLLIFVSSIIWKLINIVFFLDTEQYLKYTKIPLLIFVATGIILNFYYYKRIFPKNNIIELAENYEYYYGGLKKRFLRFNMFVFVITVLVMAVFGVLYEVYRNG